MHKTVTVHDFPQPGGPTMRDREVEVSRISRISPTEVSTARRCELSHMLSGKEST